MNNMNNEENEYSETIKYNLYELNNINYNFTSNLCCEIPLLTIEEIRSKKIDDILE